MGHISAQNPSLSAGTQQFRTSPPAPIPAVQWIYGWKDGKLANTVGSAANGDPLPTPLSYTGSAYTPAEIRAAYGFNNLPTNGLGQGQTITIIVAYGNPAMQSDLDIFCANFGIKSTKVNFVFPQGEPTNGSSIWALETCLDVEWAHTIAPEATIQLVVADNEGDLYDAVSYATTTLNANIISMSWGNTEYDSETYFDYLFQNPALNGTTFFAGAGDNRALLYPAASPYVTAVGGTSLYMSNEVVTGESAWNLGGGGVSKYETLPPFQAGINNNSGRGVPDVSVIADPYTGVAVIINGQWDGVGGTSLATPIWAALQADRLSLGNTDPILPLLYYCQTYKGASWPLRDITQGSAIYPATSGYDLCTGLGVPRALEVATLTTNSIPPARKATVKLYHLTGYFGDTNNGVIVTTIPFGLETQVLYDGFSNIPTNIGSYSITATVTDPNYTGVVKGTYKILTNPYVADTYNGKTYEIKKKYYTGWLEWLIGSFKIAQKRAEKAITKIENTIITLENRDAKVTADIDNLETSTNSNTSSIAKELNKLDKRNANLTNTINLYETMLSTKETELNRDHTNLTNQEGELTSWTNSNRH